MAKRKKADIPPPFKGKLRYTENKPGSNWEYWDERSSIRLAHEYGKSLSRTLGKLYLVYATGRKFKVYTLKKFKRQ